MRIPIIETARLIIRPPKLGDEIELNQRINESLPELQRWMPWASDPSIGPTKQYVENGVKNWASDKPLDLPMVIIDKNSKKIIGASGYNDRSDISIPKFEIGYWIATEFAGLGLITECVEALTRYAIEELKAVRVQILMDANNKQSQRVAEKAGFALEAKLTNFRLDHVTQKPANELIYVRFNTMKKDSSQVKWTYAT